MFFGLLNRRAKRNDSPAIPYRVECVCGKMLGGMRGEKALVLNCPGCSTQVLIFPSSPLALLRETIRDGLYHPAPIQLTPSVGNWRRPLVAAGITLTVVVAGFVILLKTVFRSGDPSASTNGEAVARAEEIAGRRALADSAFAKAAQHFRKARTHLTKEGEARDARRLEQLEKESALVADLLSESLAEHLQRGKGLSDKAWKDLFRERLLDKAVIFDATVHSVGGGVFRVDYPGYVSGSPMRVEIQNSVFLRSLKEQWPARLLVGLRLLDAKRDSNGSWVVLANPESVVLLTEPAIFTNSSLAVDADLEKVLRDQAELLGLAQH